MISKKGMFWLVSVSGVIVLIIWTLWDNPFVSFIFSRSYSKKDLIQNYQSKQAELEELRTYFKAIVPPARAVYIEFGRGEEIEIFHVYAKCEEVARGDENWHMMYSDTKTSQLLEKIGWNKETLKTLKAKLDRANCISIGASCKGTEVEIGYQRSGMGQYSYLIFGEPLTEKEKKDYNNGCSSIYFRERVVLEYGGGAFGPQCFEKD